MRKKFKSRSFSMMELLVVVTIIGILATIGITQYFPVREKSLGKEAIANLKLIGAAERVYRLERGTFGSCRCDCPGNGANCCNNVINGCNYFLKLDLATTYWTYRVISGSSTTFTATADRVGAGGYLNCQYSLAQNDPDGEPNRVGTCP